MLLQASTPTVIRFVLIALCFAVLISFIFFNPSSLLPDWKSVNFTSQEVLLTINETSVPLPICCPLRSPLHIGETKIDMNVSKLADLEMRWLESAILRPGGIYRTPQCRSRHKAAIVIPFRNRDDQLPIFLNHMHSLLQRQLVDYGIFVVEQINSSVPFNRGMLMNIGFKEALKMDNYQCVFLHDVDLLPENDYNLYSCPEVGKPRQMAFSLNTMGNYNPTPMSHFGGVTAFSSNDFIRINGFSNRFWGWGGEDDSLFQRTRKYNLTVVRHPAETARYFMLPHQQSPMNPDRLAVFYNDTMERTKVDGLSSLVYDRKDLQLKPLFIHIKVDIRPAN